MDGRELGSQHGVVFRKASGVDEEFCIGRWMDDCCPQSGAGVHFGAIRVDPRIGVPSWGPLRWFKGCCQGGRSSGRGDRG